MKKKYGLLTLIAAAALSWFVLKQDSKEINRDFSADKTVNTNDYSVTSFSLTQFDNNGNSIHSVVASAATINGGTTRLTNPDIITQASAGQWQISARQAISNDNFITLRLIQDVRIEKATSNDPVSNDTALNDAGLTEKTIYDGFRVTSEEIIYASQKKLISSKEKINYRDGQMLVTGTGFQADLISEEFHILNNVSGTRYGK